MLLIGLAILLAFASLALDALLPRMPPLLPFAPGGPEGARPVLSTVAASMITVAGLVFSLTLVILSVAAQQLGPRLIPLFMADRLFQTAIGSFLALFVYALLVLRGVRSESEAIHAISLTLLLVATLANVFLLVAYIHRAAASIQADSVVARLGREALATIEALPRAEDHPAEPATQDGPRTPVGTVACPASGYLQAIDTGCLLDLACRHDLRIVLNLHPGASAIEGTPLAELHGRDGPVDDGILSAVAGAVALGAKRTDTRDPVYALQGLAEIALRALSPGINDPFTAIACLDWLTAVLVAATGRQLPPERLADEAGIPRLERPGLEWGFLLERALADVRHAARDQPRVLAHLADRLAVLAGAVRTPDQRRAVERETAALPATLRAGVPDELTRRQLEERTGRVAAAVAARLPEGTGKGAGGSMHGQPAGAR